MSGARETPSPALTAGSRWRNPRGLGPALALLWLVLAGALALQWGEGPRFEQTTHPWLPAEHRHDEDVGIARLEITRGSTAATDDLLLAADHVRETLDARWLPLAPPAEALAAWNDAHVLLLMPMSVHPALRARMTNAAIEDAVRALRGRLSSPFFAVHGAEARRDPLGLRSLAMAETADHTGEREPSTMATERGDLLSRDGHTLWLLHAARRDEATWESLAVELDRRGITLTRPDSVSTDARTRLSDAAARLAWLVGGGLTALLAAAHRAMARPLGLLLGTGLLACACMRFAEPWDALSLPWVALAVVGAIAVTSVPRRFDALGTLLLATAMAPLAWSPIPTWERWAFPWLLLCIGMAGVAQLVLLLGARTPGSAGGTLANLRWTRRAWVALLLILGGGAIVTIRLEPKTFVEATPAQPAEAETPFDPARVLWAWSAEAATPEAALDEAALDERSWRGEAATSGVRVEGPGHLLLAPRELALRREALANLAVSDRLAQLEDTLQAHGFRSAAFGEFLRSAADEHRDPSARAALQTPLARWMKRHLAGEGGRVRAQTFLHLPPHPEALPNLTHHDGRPVTLLGPMAFDATLRRALGPFVVSTALLQLWLAMTLVWLRHRDLRLALFVAAMAVANLVTTSLLLLLFDVHPALPAFPAWLWVGAYTMMTTLRGFDRAAPRAAQEPWLLGLLPLVPAFALVVLPVPEWEPLGIVLGVGGPLGVLWAWVVAPRLLPVQAPPTASVGEP